MATTPCTLFMIIFTILWTQKLSIASNNTKDPSKCMETERVALTRFKQTITDESGRLSSWIGQDCCSWKGVICSNKTGHVLQLNLHNPTFLDLEKLNNPYDPQSSEYAANYSRSCFSGEISPSLLNLKNLHSLDLSMNNFSMSEIPKFFGSFKNLRHLDLSIARFQGNIPPHIGNLTKLVHLDLSDFWNNRLSSNSLQWLSSLSSLKHLDLSGVHLGQAKDWLDSVNRLPSLMKLNLSNTLVATIPPLSNPDFTSLVSLDLQENIINSNFVPRWLFNITTLVELRLDSNGFRCPIPDDLSRLSSLNILGLSRNYFNNSLPDSLFNLRNLTYLDISQNRLQGSIPDSILNLCNLEFLDLTQSGFTGGIPGFGVNNENGCFKNLEYLRISYNSLNGPVPESIGTLLSLKELDISNNVLNGSISSSLGHLSNLEKFDFSNNSLSGVVSESHFANLSKLSELSMSLNNLVFNISSNWIPPFQLESVKLASCKLGPTFPSWLQTQRGVKELRISSSGISDILPDWFERVYSKIHYLDISRNNISGLLPQFEETDDHHYRRLILNSNSFYGPFRTIPSDVLLLDVSNNTVSGSIVPPQNGENLALEVLIVSNNQMNGTFPDSLCGIKTMMILDLANNQFSGKIPDCIGEMELSMLDLTNNSFHGEIPNSLSGLRLFSLHLYNNNFHGQLPSLENMTFLRILNVGKNSFTGPIPPWINRENLQSLAFLNLQSNKFHGEIPDTLCQLPQLQLINLARNNITGKIPPCVGNLSAMKIEHSSTEYLTLDVDYGGSIPEIVNGIERRFTKTMPFLTSIDFSESNLVGEIPENLTGLVELKNLNLAGNHLTGKIPEKIGAMRALISLDLSKNQLSGQIPTGLSSLNFLTNLKLSFNNLSGRIPTGNQLQLLEPSVYEGNDGLCGPPLARSCNGGAVAAAPPDSRSDISNNGDDGDDDSLFPWFYAGIAPGFGVGFLVACGVLHFVKSWGYAVSQYVERIATGK